MAGKTFVNHLSSATTNIWSVTGLVLPTSLTAACLASAEAVLVWGYYAGGWTIKNYLQLDKNVSELEIVKKKKKSQESEFKVEENTFPENFQMKKQTKMK